MKQSKWKFLWDCCHGKIPVMIFIVLLGVLRSFLEVRYALNTQKIIDNAVQRNTNAFFSACIELLIIIVITLLCYFLSSNFKQKLDADMDRIMKGKLLDYLLNGRYEFVNSYHSGDLITRMNDDIDVLCSGVVYFIPGVVSLLTRMAASVVVLLLKAPQFTIVLLIVCAGITGVTILIRKRMTSIYKKVSEENGKVTGLVQELLTKLLMIQALDVTEEAERRGEEALDSRKQIQYKRKNMNLALSTGSNILIYLVSFASLVYFAIQLLHGKVSFGELTAMTQLADLLASPFFSIPSMVRSLLAMDASEDRVTEIIDVAPQPDHLVDIEKVIKNMKSIDAKHLTFSYGDDNVIKDLTFSIPIGGITVITGSSGIGKSTLLKLILGIYPVENGSLTVNTEDENINLTRATRGIFSYVPQGNLLLSGTLLDNLLLVNPAASEDEISNAVYISSMDDYLESLPQGLNTELRENGVGLSEGQGQRLSLARAVLRKAPVLLLDEVTSSLDIETEKKVLSRIRECSDKTCVVVTHRPEVLNIADLHLHITDDGIEILPLGKS